MSRDIPQSVTSTCKMVQVDAPIARCSPSCQALVKPQISLRPRKKLLTTLQAGFHSEEMAKKQKPSIIKIKQRTTQNNEPVEKVTTRWESESKRQNGYSLEPTIWTYKCNPHPMTSLLRSAEKPKRLHPCSSTSPLAPFLRPASQFHYNLCYCFGNTTQPSKMLRAKHSKTKQHQWKPKEKGRQSGRKNNKVMAKVFEKYQSRSEVGKSDGK